MIVLDTNVISEVMRPAPAPAVVAFLDRLDRREVHTTAITVAEIRLGLVRLPRGRRRTTLANAAAELFETVFWGKVLAFDEHSAEAYAAVAGRALAAGRPMAMADAQIAAICVQHDATLATRDHRDFASAGIRLADPWSTSSPS